MVTNEIWNEKFRSLYFELILKLILKFIFDRKIEAIEDILSENFDPQFNEVDVLGVVINIGNLNNQGK